MSRGLTLVELAVAILVLSIGTLAALRGLDHATRSTALSEVRALAQIAARNRAEELRLFGSSANLPREVVIGGQGFVLEVANEATAGGLVQTTVSARAPGAAGASIVVFLAPGLR